MSLHWIIRAITGCVILALGVGLIIERRAHLSVRDKYARLEQSYTDAARQADEYQRLQTVIVANEQSNISKDVVHDLETKLAAARYTSDRLAAVVTKLRSQADRSAPGTGELPAISGAAEGVAGQDVCVPAGAILIAQEIEIRRNALIDWAVRQSEVSASPGLQSGK
jgi:signal transduction histidine kinase